MTRDLENNGREEGDASNSLIFRAIFMESEIGLMVLDSKYRLVNWNPWITRHCGIALNDAVGKGLIEIFAELKQSSVERAVVSAIKNGMSSVVSNTLNRKPFPFKTLTGEALQQQITIKPISNDDQEHCCLIQITDVSAAVSREKQLKEQARRTQVFAEKLAQEKERAQVTLDSIIDGVITTDEKGHILSMNPVAEMLTGCFEEEVHNKPVVHFFKLIHEKTRKSIPCPVQQCLDQQEIVANDNDHILLRDLEYFSITDSVAPIFDDDRNVLGAVLVFRDVTQSRALSAELNWQAMHDPLTGLANRRKFELGMKELLGKAKNDDLKHHLLYLDLDQFKVVNDTCGHDAGDELLKQVTNALAKKLRKADLLARLGGDEFGVLLESCDAANTLAVANNLRQAVEDFRFGWQTQSFKIGVSIGVAEITGTESKASEVLSAADAACYVAKEAGRNRVHFHQGEGSAVLVHQQEMQWISRLQAALDKDNFTLYLQRIQDVSCKEAASDHYEVLLRMVDENGNIIPPGAFLPAAERYNLVGSIDYWVVENVFSKLRALQERDLLPDKLMIAINLSGASMANESLLQRISELLDQSKLPAQFFCFEVTETAAITNLTQATKFLNKLRAKGCKVALDDFGSGLSSFAYLKDLPVDYLKIDGYFVKDIAIDGIDKAFVESINQIGQVMGLETIAEFVENDAILDILTEIGVNYAQGYGIHKPAPFESVFENK